MSTPSNAVPLTRRLVGQYLAFGFGCLLFCFATALIFQFRGKLEALAPVVALLSAAILAVGAVFVWRTTKLCSAVEHQLARVSRQSPDGEFAVHRIAGSDPAAAHFSE
jgi:hypothetical protein